MLLPIEAKKGKDMSNEWFYKNNKNKEIGPISASVLKKLAEAGVINKETLIKKGNGNWVKGAMIKGLITNTVNEDSKGIESHKNLHDINSSNGNSNSIEHSSFDKTHKNKDQNSLTSKFYLKLFLIFAPLVLIFVSVFFILKVYIGNRSDKINEIGNNKLNKNNEINIKDGDNDKMHESLEEMENKLVKEKMEIKNLVEEEKKKNDLKILEKKQNYEKDRLEKEKKDKQKKELEFMEQKKQYLLSRPSDVMGACWGDSIEDVGMIFNGKFDKIYEETVYGLKTSKKMQGCVQFVGAINVGVYEMNITYCFFNNKLVSVSLFMFNKFRNNDTFGCYLELLGIIESKYGKGDFLDLGPSKKNINWTSPRHLINLYYTGALPSSVKVEYKSRSSDFDDYEKLKKEERINFDKIKMDSLKKGF